MGIVHKIETYLNKRLPEYLLFFERMVGINSYTENSEGVNRLGKYTGSLFSRLGFLSSYHDSPNPLFGKHLVLQKSGTSKRGIACISHLDTVFPESEEKQNNFIWHISGDKIYGPGTNDIKGGTIVLYMMLDALRECAGGLFNAVQWTLLLNASEEVMSDDFAELCFRTLTDDTMACLVFESGQLDTRSAKIVTSRKGRATFRVIVSGKGGHAGSDHMSGANAIVQLSEVISKIAEITDYNEGITCNIGTVQGGVSINRIPEEAFAYGEIRAFSPAALERALRSLKDIDRYKKVGAFSGGYSCKIEIDVDRVLPPWPENEGSGTLLMHWTQAARELGLEIIEEKRGGLSDGNYLWDRFPTLDGLGLDGENAHCSQQEEDLSKEQEYAYLSSLVPKTLLNIMAVIKMVDSDAQIIL